MTNGWRGPTASRLVEIAHLIGERAEQRGGDVQVVCWQMLLANLERRVRMLAGLLELARAPINPGRSAPLRHAFLARQVVGPVVAERALEPTPGFKNGAASSNSRSSRRSVFRLA